MYSSHNRDKANEMNLLNKIVSSLKDIESNQNSTKINDNFCGEETLAPSDIKVTVEGVGELCFPLSKACIQKLINVSTAAKFGMGEKTLLDQNVRNTQMIESKCLDVTINEESMDRIIRNMQKALVLPTDITLTPHLHNMLIYGPGQFFNKHRDSEKLQNMVATLVIVLPSPHIGGDLIIEHGTKRHIFSSQNVDEENAKCICFYSDCLHNVNKVQCGYRVVLTFNVVLETGELPHTVPFINEELKVAVRDYFNTNTIVKDRPKKVVFFLNHTYSEHSLLWNLLKGEDGRYASSLRSVAWELDLDAHLVLANINQTWSLTEQYEPEPGELLDTDITLSCWVNTHNVKLPFFEYCPTESEICFTRETHYKNFDPTREQSEYTGNEGATVDYWYKRAAVVLWKKSDTLLIYFELNYDGAMTKLRRLISVPGNERKVTKILKKAAGLSQKDRPTTNDFETFVSAALYVNVKKKAQAILSPFRLNVLIPENVKLLVQLQQQYGTNCLIKLVDTLQGNSRGYYSNSAMTSEIINPFVVEFLSSGGDRSVIESLLKAEVAALKSRNTSIYFREAGDLGRPRELFKAFMTTENVALQEELAQYLVSQSKLFPKSELVKLYQQLQVTFPLESLELLRARLEESVKQELLSQTRDMDDWSLSEVLSCTCEHCNVLKNFLHSKTKVSKSWTVKADIRKHIMSVLECSKAPVDVTIDREKKPFNMLLVKRTTLHAEAAGKCAELKSMVQTLELNTTAKKRQSLKEHVDEKRQKL